MVGGRERSVEEAWLGARELEVGLADRPEPQPGACRRVRARAYLAYAIGHASSELSDRLVTDGREERGTVAEMPVGGVGDDPDHARHLAQHDRVRPPRSGQLDAGLDERGPDRAAGTRSPSTGRIARLRLSRVVPVACWHFENHSGQRPQLRYSGQCPQSERLRLTTTKETMA